MYSGDYIPEKELNNHPQSIGFDQIDKIKEEMTKSICKIKCPKGGFGVFFAKFHFQMNSIYYQ